MHEMMRQVVEAALDQPNPTPELVTALNTFLVANEHRARIRYDNIFNALLPLRQAA